MTKANPICSSVSEEQIDGRSNATSTKFIRPKGVNKFVLRDCDICDKREQNICE